MERVIRVSVVVSNGVVCFRTKVQGESIEEAVRLAAMSHSGGEVRVLFPIDAEAFFIEESASAMGTVYAGVMEEAR